MKTNSINTDARQPASRYLFLRQAFSGKRGTTLLLFLLLAGGAFAHKAKGNDKQQDKLDWKLDATVSNVSFYHALSECDGKKVAYLKFVNKNSYAVTVSWKEAVKTQFRADETAFRGEQHLSLPPGETMENNCSGSTCKACLLVTDQVSPAYPAQIISYSFKDISVVK